jgi:hypothetical protein
MVKRKIVIEIPWYHRYSKILLALLFITVALYGITKFMSPGQPEIIGIGIETTSTTTTVNQIPGVPNSNDLLNQPVALLPFGLSLYSWLFIIAGFAIAWKLFNHMRY